MRTFSPALLALGTLLASESAALCQERGYWVVVGSIDTEDQNLDKAVGDIWESVERCGYKVFNDSSGKFEGFVPGFEVFVIGPFNRKGTAEIARDRVRPCVQDAYVKFGGYLGE